MVKFGGSVVHPFAASIKTIQRPLKFKCSISMSKIPESQEYGRTTARQIQLLAHYGLIFIF